jgi:hypothetical protein
MAEQKLKRPMGVKLILAYNILHLLFIFYSMALGYGSFIGILYIFLYIFSLYYGLWKMREDWMWVLVFFLILSTAFYIYSMFVSLDVFSMILVILNIISVYWLCANKNIFIKPEKGKSALGTKSEWIRVALIILGIIVIPISLGMINSDYILYGILAIPIWIIFVWFIVPKLVKRIRK